MIEPAELHRVFPPVADTISRNTRGNGSLAPATGEMCELRARFDVADARLADALETIADLRRRLDAADEERRRVLTLAAPGRRWWLAAAHKLITEAGLDWWALINGARSLIAAHVGRAAVACLRGFRPPPVSPNARPWTHD